MADLVIYLTRQPVPVSPAQPTPLPGQHETPLPISVAPVTTGTGVAPISAAQSAHPTVVQPNVQSAAKQLPQNGATDGAGWWAGMLLAGLSLLGLRMVGKKCRH